jgi:methyl-accepting chemotaxis protein
MLGTVAVVLLRQASATSLELSERSLKNLVVSRANFWKGKEEGYLQQLRGLADVIREFETIPVRERREWVDNILLNTLKNNEEFVRIFTIFRPNALDGMDGSYTDRPGSTSTGQYAMTWGRDTGRIVATPNLVVAKVTEWINGPNALKDRIENPTPFNVNGKDTHIIRMGVPIRRGQSDEVVGNLTVLINMEPMQVVLQNALKTFKEIDAISIYSNDTTIMASFQSDRIGKKMADVDTQYGDYKDQVNKAILEGTEFQCVSNAPPFEEDLHMVLIPFGIGNSDTTWTIMMGSPDSYIMKEVNEMTEFAVIMTAIAVILTVVIVRFVLSGTTKPIAKVADTLKDISEGEGDLTKSINVDSKDEVGDLAKYFNMTIGKVKDLIRLIKWHAIELSDQGLTLSIAMRETAAAMEEITNTIQNLKNHTINQSASVIQTKASIEEMVATNRSVAETLAKNVESIQKLNASSERGRIGLRSVANDIEEIGRESKGLIGINTVIQNIADKTNLLSMNAAIEAAHVGEAGKGFAVVADEIRKLAESSHEQSETIVNVLKRIKQSIDKITGSTGNVLHEFDAIEQNIKNVTEQADRVQKAMSEQAEGSKEIIAESGNLAQIIEETTNGVSEIAVAVEEINTSVQNVNEISAKNQEGVETLMKEVSQFKID